MSDNRYANRYDKKTTFFEKLLGGALGVLMLGIFLIPGLIYAYILIFLFEWIFFDLNWADWPAYASLFGIAILLFILGVGRSSIDGAFWKVFAFKGK